MILKASFWDGRNTLLCLVFKGASLVDGVVVGGAAGVVVELEEVARLARMTACSRTGVWSIVDPGAGHRSLAPLDRAASPR